ncbi:MAG: N-acetyltransferase family protein [Halobacteriales archaeon]
MSASREYPPTDAGPFPEPPADVDDGAGRSIRLELATEADVDALVAMYRDFDPAQRAQGVPPGDPDRVEPWVRTVLGDGHHVVARHGDRIVGHAMLVPDADGSYELAIFVHQDYQGAGVGGALIHHLLGAGAAAGVRRVWLTVERWNAPAIRLYRSVGFETVLADRFDLEMALALPEAG